MSPRAHATRHTRGIGFPRLYDLLMLGLTRGREADYRDDVLDLSGVAPGQRLLDIGCGTGTLAIAAWRRAQPGGSVAGTDLSERMLAVARRKARRAGADVTFRHGDASSLPFGDEEFDRVTVTTVMHAVPEGQRTECLREARRVLRPTGRILIVDFAGAPTSRNHWVAKHGPHGDFDLAQLRDPMANEGFVDIEQGTLGWLSLHFLAGTKGP